MPQVRVTLSTATVEYPAGTVLGNLRVRLLNAASLPLGTQLLALPVSEVVFNNVQPGAYTFEAQQLTSGGIPIGSAFTAPVVVEAPQPVAGPAVVGVSVTVL